MIALLSGKIEHITGDYVIVMTAGGVGYRVWMAANGIGLMAKGSSVRLWVHTAVREDAITLYGFPGEDEYALFELLLTVKGVGPKVALGIIGSSTPEGFYLAVRNKDLHYLMQLPGIGKKGAERLVLELKDKVGDVETGGLSKPEASLPLTVSGSLQEAAEALASLGYVRAEIMPVLAQIKDGDKLSGEEVLRQALRLFAGR